MVWYVKSSIVSITGGTKSTNILPSGIVAGIAGVAEAASVGISATRSPILFSTPSRGREIGGHCPGVGASSVYVTPRNTASPAGCVGPGVPIANPLCNTPNTVAALATAPRLTKLRRVMFWLRSVSFGVESLLRVFMGIRFVLCLRTRGFIKRERETRKRFLSQKFPSRTSHLLRRGRFRDGEIRWKPLPERFTGAKLQCK